MRPAVRAYFYEFTAKFEGVLPYFYLDVKGLVTIAVGNLVDPFVAAISLPMLRTDGTSATSEEISAEWRVVKSRQDLAHVGAGAFKDITRLRLSDDGIRQLVNARLSQNDHFLSARFRAYENAPADAQIAVLSMAWAMGPAFRFPKFAAAFETGDFITCANECAIDVVGNPGVIPRNAANKLALLNAEAVAAQGLDREVLNYPADIYNA